jgi:hypothetical protein
MNEGFYDNWKSSLLLFPERDTFAFANLVIWGRFLSWIHNYLRFVSIFSLTIKNCL